MKLSEILKGINVKNTYEDCEVTNVTQDSRMIEEGCLLAEGTLEELRGRIPSGTRLLIRAARMPEGLPLQHTGENQYETAISQDEEIPVLVRRIVAGGGDIYQVSVKKPSLEDIYFTLTAKRKEAAR